jgi:hypothetical protein
MLLANFRFASDRMLLIYKRLERSLLTSTLAGHIFLWLPPRRGICFLHVHLISLAAFSLVCLLNPLFLSPMAHFVSVSVVRAHLVQIAVLANHQNGRDTHIRQVKIYGPAK